MEMRIKAVLEGMEFAEGERGRYAMMVQAALRPGSRGPEGIEESFEGEGRVRGEVYALFRLAGCVRAMSRFGGEVRPLESYVRGQFVQWKGWAEGRIGFGLSPVTAVWYHWMLVAGEKSLGVAADQELLQRLWISGFAEQGDDGRLLRWDAEEAMEGRVYDELTGIHAGYNSAKAMGDGGMMEQVGRVVRWHVGNTQPDNTTNEPWGLAAFAALDETGTFAEQQLQDAVVQLRNGGAAAGRVPVSVGLLADALMTMEGG